MAYGMPASRNDPDTRKRVAQYYEAGVSYKEILRRFGISNYVLDAILEEYKVTRRVKKASKPMVTNKP